MDSPATRKSTLSYRLKGIVLSYEICRHCDHFIEENNPAECVPRARFIHLDDGEQEYDHDAERSGQANTLHEWTTRRPDLFTKYPDGKIGPNSMHHSRRGKVDARPHPDRRQAP